jgi:hypothetical protein
VAPPRGARPGGRTLKAAARPPHGVTSGRGGGTGLHLPSVDLLAIYVEDHLALSLGGVRLAKRSLSENRGNPFGEFLARVLPELEEDRRVLKDVARVLGRAPSLLKEAAVVAGEYAGRLKLNGRLTGYSDLSRIWELEGIMAGTESRRGLWKLLSKAQRRDARLKAFDFDRLEERAHRHREELDRWRIRAAEVAFGGKPARRALSRAAPART